jgi:hypothetical protein
MKSILIAAITVFLTRQVSLAQETLSITRDSTLYNLSVQVSGCGGKGQSDDSNECSGKARVKIYRKGAKAPFQVLSLPNIQIYRDQIAYNPAVDQKSRELYNDEYSFIFGDFNFDGQEDLAICNGRNGGYGMPSYNVYLYNVGLSRFVKNRALSELTDGASGLFSVDLKKKQLTVFAKSGCCYHVTAIYRVQGAKPVLIENTTEDANLTGGVVVTTTRRLVKGRWIRKVKKERIQEEKPEK